MRIEAREHERELAAHLTSVEVRLESARARRGERPIEELLELVVFRAARDASLDG